MLDPKMRMLIKKKCKACGHSVIVKKEKGITPAPKDCATCRSLGVEKAIEQRLMCARKSDKTVYEIKDKKVMGLKEHLKEYGGLLQ